ncbi:MAG TPA: ubiquinol oxidase subunit II [Candidatus Saccharimonadales bacterium]
MRKTKLIIIGFALLTTAVLAALYFFSQSTVMMNPAGEIGEQQRDLIVLAVGLMAIIVIPVFVLLFFIAWRYRAGNKRADYRPNWDHSAALETTWWGVPIVIIGILAVVTWQSSHALDPYRPIESEKKPLKIQVVALQWKWLFIYPEQKIASVNYARLPEDTPINFELTSDAPMNSFWIPALGSQVYAMSGMSTKLHLIANKTGIYPGSSANISGEGFAGMTFKAEVTSRESFDIWERSARSSAHTLDSLAYAELAKPSRSNQEMTYVLADTGLYDMIVHKYINPPATLPPGTEVKAESQRNHGGRE